MKLLFTIVYTQNSVYAAIIKQNRCKYQHCQQYCNTFAIEILRRIFANTRPTQTKNIEFAALNDAIFMNIRANLRIIQRYRPW